MLQNQPINQKYNMGILGAYKIRNSRWNFKPGEKNNFKLSRSKIELFFSCPRCFYLDNRLGIKRPEGPPFNLNKAVDALLKKEFDIHRAKGEPHPLMKSYKIDAIPYAHEDLNIWRENFKGVTVLHKKSGLTVSGAVDDLWVNPKGELIVVDYKATSKDEEVNIDAEWQNSYKRQMEFYQWLLRQNGFKVSNTGYFVYCNGDADKEAFDGKLEFDIKLIPYTGDDIWVEKAINESIKCLTSDNIPKANSNCDYCGYRQAAKSIENDKVQTSLL